MPVLELPVRLQLEIAEVGRLLERAREAEALGLVESREEALDYLRGPAGRDDSREGGEPRVGT